MNNLDNKYNALRDAVNALSESDALLPNSNNAAITALKEVTASTIDYLNSYSERIEALKNERKTDIHTETSPTSESETVIDEKLTLIHTKFGDIMASPEKNEAQNILSTILDVTTSDAPPEELTLESEYERDFLNANKEKAFVLENLNLNPIISDMVKIHDCKTDVEVELHKDVASQYLEKIPAGVNIPGYGYIESNSGGVYTKNDDGKPANDANVDDIPKSNDVKSDSINKLRIGDVVDMLMVTSPRGPANAVAVTRIYYNATILNVNELEVFVIASHMATVYNYASDYIRCRDTNNQNNQIRQNNGLSINSSCIDAMNTILYNVIQVSRISYNYFDIVANSNSTKTYDMMFKK